MVFANLSYQDKEAFFSLLDEYFASRPHLAPSSSNPSSSPSIPISAITSRLLPPSRSPAPISPPATESPTSPTASTHSYGASEAQARPDMAQRFISSSIKLGTAGTKAGVGAIAKNKDAMDLLGKAGMGGIVRGADKRINSPPPVSQGQVVEIESTTTTVVPGGKKAAPAPPAKKKGVAGLVSGKSFGHVDTSSKMSAFTSMWKDPQKAQAPTVEHTPSPALSTKHTSLPPPLRRDGSSSAYTPPAVEETYAEESGEGQAQALYDYAASDSNDLTVQTGQVVNVVEKTSADSASDDRVDMRRRKRTKRAGTSQLSPGDVV